MDHLNGDSDRDDIVKHLIITGVKFTDRQLSRGAYGRIFLVCYNGVMCAAKIIHPNLMEGVSAEERLRIIQDFLQECLLHSKLHHPNIVKMLGVTYQYPDEQAVLPVLVMELMEYSLTQLLEYHQNIPMYVKLSILQDVSRAIHYLHTLNPPMMHRDLNSNNILLTTSLVAKLGNFEAMKKVLILSEEMTKGISEFLSPEAFKDHPHYGLPLDVFSFGCVACHVITQQWPFPRPERISNPMSSLPLALSQVERRKHYIDQINKGPLKQLVIACLDNNQEKRPSISVVSERITSIVTGNLTFLYCELVIIVITAYIAM